MSHKHRFIAVVAASENNVIGINNRMPWHLPDDLKFFQKNTLGHPILMGRNTWETIGSKPLRGRLNIVVSRSLAEVPAGVVHCRSLGEAQSFIASELPSEFNTGTACIIGGGQIYAQTMDITDEILMTRVHAEFENGMVFYPEFREGPWSKVWEEYHPKDERHALDFTFERWVRN